MEWFDSTKSIVENLYFLSGMILTVSLIIGIIQISLTKKSIVINSNRSAISFSAKQIEVYCNKITKLQNALYFKQNEKKISILKFDIEDFKRSSLFKKLGQEKAQEIYEQRVSFALEALDILNAMEAFAVYFINGVADEKIAYSSIGRTYCSSVEKLYFEIALSSDIKPFSNLIELYRIWSNRLKREKLSIESEQLLNAIEKLEKLKNENIKPIETE